MAVAAEARGIHQPEVGYEPTVQQQVLALLSECSGGICVNTLVEQTTGPRSATIESVRDASVAGVVSLSCDSGEVLVELANGDARTPATSTPVVQPGRIILSEFQLNGSDSLTTRRPAVVVTQQNGSDNKQVTVVPLTASRNPDYVESVPVKATEKNQLERNSVALCRDVQTVFKDEIIDVFGTVSDRTLCEIRAGLENALISEALICPHE
jgi:mRNA-degrading endonuclease toxin of MazEF toxin-antitoxin module